VNRTKEIDLTAIERRAEFHAGEDSGDDDVYSLPAEDYLALIQLAKRARIGPRITPRRCPRCGSPMVLEYNDEGDWRCKSGLHEGKCLFWDYELDMTLGGQVAALREALELVRGHAMSALDGSTDKSSALQEIANVSHAAVQRAWIKWTEAPVEGFNWPEPTPHSPGAWSEHHVTALGVSALVRHYLREMNAPPEAFLALDSLMSETIRRGYLSAPMD